MQPRDRDRDQQRSSTVTREEFRQDPRAVFTRAMTEGSVTILDASGKARGTITVPSAPRDDE